PLRYAPTGVVTRGQMATFLVRFLEASGATVAGTAPAAFTDTAGHSHAPNIDRLAAMGIVGGFSDGLYRPDAPVTRAQMASFIARTWEHRLGTPLAADADFFEDDSLDTHEPNINGIAQAGIAAGVTAVAYDPASPVRRDQMATFLARTMAELVASGVTALP
ncbi:MAG: S-layer homology domain-containing protein, partial [Acidimicrobiales bacterium]